MMKNQKRELARTVIPGLGLEPSRHAMLRMKGRSIAQEAIEAVCAFGRPYLSFGLTVYRLLRRDVERAWREGVDVRAYEGIRVVLAEALVVSVYREHRRPGSRRRGAGYDAYAGRRPSFWADDGE
jgi:hypothetical protein